MANLGTRIKEFGLSKFGTLKDFASALDMSYPNLYQYIGENAKSVPGTEMLKKLKALGCDINWLLSEEEDLGPPVVREPSPEYKIKQLEKEVEELKGENEQLRSSISQITTVAQAAGQINKKKRRK